MCSDESKACPFKVPERFTYVSDTTGIEEPSYMRKFSKCWTQWKLSSAMCVWGILNNFKTLQQFLRRAATFFSPSQFCDPLHKHNWISLHQVAINGKNNTLKKSPKNNVFQPAVKSSNLFVLLHICIIGQTRNSL